MRKNTLRWPFVLLFLLACGLAESCFGSCPLMTHKDADIQREFQNVCQTIANPIANNAVVSSATITTVSISSATISTATINNLRGVTNGSNACPGCVGEFVKAQASAVSAAADDVFGDITSISLTAGDWDVSANMFLFLNGATYTANAAWLVAISTYSGSPNSDQTYGENLLEGGAVVGWAASGLSVASYRLSITSTKTVYLKGSVRYTLGTPKFYGAISARRVR